MIFGRKSEKLTGALEQLEFRLEELETEQAADEAAQAATEATQPSSTRADSKRRSRPARKPLPEGLRVKWSTIFPRTLAAPIAAVLCASSAKTSLNNWSASRQDLR